MSDLERERREILHRLEEATEDLEEFEREHPAATVMELSDKLVSMRGSLRGSGPGWRYNPATRQDEYSAANL